jgi:hypothetical protein
MISANMKSTYADQRLDLNQMDPPTTTATLKQNWPFLFEVGYLFDHFDRLTGASIRNMDDQLSSMFSQIIAMGKTDIKNRIFFLKESGSETKLQCIKFLAFKLKENLDYLIKEYQVN